MSVAGVIVDRLHGVDPLAGKRAVGNHILLARGKRMVGVRIVLERERLDSTVRVGQLDGEAGNLRGESKDGNVQHVRGGAEHLGKGNRNFVTRRGRGHRGPGCAAAVLAGDVEVKFADKVCGGFKFELGHRNRCGTALGKTELESGVGRREREAHRAFRAAGGDGLPRNEVAVVHVRIELAAAFGYRLGGWNRSGYVTSRSDRPVGRVGRIQRLARVIVPGGPGQFGSGLVAAKMISAWSTLATGGRSKAL